MCSLYNKYKMIKIVSDTITKFKRYLPAILLLFIMKMYSEIVNYSISVICSQAYIYILGPLNLKA